MTVTELSFHGTVKDRDGQAIKEGRLNGLYSHDASLSLDAKVVVT